MSNPWLTRRVLNYAHQGGAIEAPSSTLFALHRALEIGATALELDVHLTRDGQVVVAHDATVERMTNGRGAIVDLTLAEVRALDAAHGFSADGAPDAFPFRGRGPADAMFRVPTLDAIFETFPRTFLNFDVKAGERGSEQCAHALAQAITSRKREADVIVASFDDALTAAVHAEAPGVGTSIGSAMAMAVWQAVNEDAPLPELHHVAMQLPARFESLEVVTAKLVERAHEAGLAVHVWTIDERAEMERLLALGVDGLITDRPSVLAAVLREREATYRRA